MNYFELYPGDYLRDTTRLTLVEHGAYLRLLMAYYGEETPLPADPGDLFVIVSAISASDKAAVRKVADRFFPVGEDGLRHNGRADEEIVKAQRRIETARQNGAKGGRKQNPTGNPSGNPAGNPMGSPRGNPVGTQRGTHSGEALHTPHANISVGRSEASTQIPTGEPTDAGRACLLMRQAGCIQTNPSHPDLLAALAEGVSPEALRDTAAEGIAAGKSKPFAWAITTARARHAEGATTIPQGANHGHANSGAGRKLSAVEQVEQRIRERRESESGDGATLTLGHG